MKKLGIFKKLILAFKNPKELSVYIKSENFEVLFLNVLIGAVLSGIFISMVVNQLYIPDVVGNLFELALIIGFLLIIIAVFSVIISLFAKVSRFSFRETFKMVIYPITLLFAEMSALILFSVSVYIFDLLDIFLLLIFPILILSLCHFIYLQFMMFGRLSRKKCLSAVNNNKIEDFEEIIDRELRKNGVFLDKSETGEGLAGDNGFGPSQGLFFGLVYFVLAIIFWSVFGKIFGIIDVDNLIYGVKADLFIVIISIMYTSFMVIRGFFAGGLVRYFVASNRSVAMNSIKRGVFAVDIKHPISLKKAIFLDIPIIMFLTLMVFGFIQNKDVFTPFILLIWAAPISLVFVYKTIQFFTYLHPNLVIYVIRYRKFIGGLFVLLIISLNIYMIYILQDIVKDINSPVQIYNSFVINGCGENTMLDERTGLCWVNAFPTKVVFKNYEGINTFCDGLGSESGAKWRLPRLHELSDLFMKVGAKRVYGSNRIVIENMKKLGFNVGDYSARGCNYYLGSRINRFDLRREGYVVLFNAKEVSNSLQEKEYSVACVRGNK